MVSLVNESGQRGRGGLAFWDVGSTGNASFISRSMSAKEGRGTGSLVFPEDTAGARNRDARDFASRTRRRKVFVGTCKI